MAPMLCNGRGFGGLGLFALPSFSISISPRSILRGVVVLSVSLASLIAGAFTAARFCSFASISIAFWVVVLKSSSRISTSSSSALLIVGEGAEVVRSSSSRSGSDTDSRPASSSSSHTGGSSWTVKIFCGSWRLRQSTAPAYVEERK